MLKECLARVHRSIRPNVVDEFMRAGGGENSGKGWVALSSATLPVVVAGMRGVHTVQWG